MKKLFRGGNFPVIRSSSYHYLHYCFLMRSVRIAVSDTFIEVVEELESQCPFGKWRKAKHLNDILAIQYSSGLTTVFNQHLFQEVAAPIRNSFISFLRHIRPFGSTTCCFDSVIFRILNGSMLPPTFNDTIHTLKKDLLGLTSYSINHLNSYNSASSTEENKEKGLIEEGQLSRTTDEVTDDKDSDCERKQTSDEAIEEMNEIESSESNRTTFILQNSTVLGNQDLKFNEQGKLLVFIDGACSSNGRTIAKAGYGVWFNYNHPLNVSAPVRGIPTNNNAEIQAATRAISIAHNLGIRKIKLHTDSRFLINCMTQWIHKWKKNNWMTAAKQSVKNKECLSELDNIKSLMEDVEWEYVEAHKGIAGNEAADVLAKKGATMFKSVQDPFSEGDEN